MQRKETSKQKQSEEKRLEKPNLISSSLSNIGMNLKKTAGGILGRVLKIVGILAGGWLLKNIGGIIETVQKGRQSNYRCLEWNRRFCFGKSA